MTKNSQVGMRYITPKIWVLGKYYYKHKQYVQKL